MFRSHRTAWRVPLTGRAPRVMLVQAGAMIGPAGAATTPSNPAPPTADQGSIGVRIIDVPAATQNDPRARLYVVDHLNPGTTIHRRIEVTNTTAGVAHVSLYPAAAAITGGAFLGAEGHTPNDLTTWTSITPAAPDIPADGNVTATVTIAVPADASPGEQYGVIWAEVASAPAGGSGGIVAVNRVGIRMYLDVGPGGPPASNFTTDSLTAERAADGTPMVVASVHNTGGRALDMSGTLQLKAGPGGLSAGPFPAVLGTTLAIGATTPVTIALDKQLPAGPWDATVTLHSGPIERSATARITFPASGASAPVSTRTAAHSGLLYALIAGLVILLLGAGALLVHLMRRRPPGSTPEPMPHTPATDPPLDQAPTAATATVTGPEATPTGQTRPHDEGAAPLLLAWCANAACSSDRLTCGTGPRSKRRPNVTPASAAPAAIAGSSAPAIARAPSPP